MTAKSYQAITAPFRRRPWLCRALRISNRATTLCVYGIYLIYLLVLLVHRSANLLPAILVPGVGFVLLSLYRDRVNAPRPYEVLDITPIIHKDTKGHSFPSRHVFSVFVIAATLGYQHPPLGALLGVIGLLISVNRVLGGVHFPKDVLVGMALGILCGWGGSALLASLLL